MAAEVRDYTEFDEKLLASIEKGHTTAMALTIALDADAKPLVSRPGEEFRVVDRRLQALRKKQVITRERRGREIVWNLTKRSDGSLTKPETQVHLMKAAVQAIHEKRRENLRQLVRERFSGNVAALARACGKAEAQCYAILKEPPRRGLGEKLAGDIEAKLGLPPGWLESGGVSIIEPGLTNEEDLFLLSVKNALKTKQVPLHMMQTVLIVLNTAQAK